MRKLSFNMLTGAVYRILTVLTGLAVQRYLLTQYGSSINGITSSITQILSYLVILEAGIGAATVSRLHSPLRNGDGEKISALIAESGRMYRRAGAWFLVLLAVISVALPLATADELAPLTVALLTVLSGIGSVIAYLFTGKYSPLLTEDGMLWVL